MNLTKPQAARLLTFCRWGRFDENATVNAKWFDRMRTMGLMERTGENGYKTVLSQAGRDAATALGHEFGY